MFTTERIPCPRPVSNAFPFCKLHHRPILEALPRQCPFHWESPGEAIVGLRNKGFGYLDGQKDLEGGAVALAAADVCELCIGQLCRHPRVKRLRNKADG